jgi:ATP-dependent RNA helicase RhlE
MKFSDYSLGQELKRSIVSLGYVRPTDIQFKAIPPVLRGEDVLAIAQTGTGKTAAFSIPVIQLLQERKKRSRPDGIKCLIMVPTHELAIQIQDHFQRLARYTRVKSFCIHGGVDQDPQIARLNKGLDVLIATPGRLFDLASQGHLLLHRVEILILDEADHMLDLGFIKDIRDLVRLLPKRRQTLFFSATIDDKIRKLAYSIVKNAIRIQISPKDPVAKNIHHTVAFIGMDDKRFFLERIIQQHQESKILVFVRTRVRAERVAKAMERVNIRAGVMHGDKDQEERKSAMQGFRSGELKVLIATDVSARGIDIPDVDFVINYDIPDREENYVHRVGRTGRGIKKGEAVSFCSDEERTLLDRIEEYLGAEIEVLAIEKEDYESIVDFADNTKTDWKSLIKEAEEEEKSRKKKPYKGKGK